MSDGVGCSACTSVAEASLRPPHFRGGYGRGRGFGGRRLPAGRYHPADDAFNDE